MAKLDKQAQGIAGLLKTVPSPEPLSVDMINEIPAAAAVLVRAVVDACAPGSTHDTGRDLFALGNTHAAR